SFFLYRGNWLFSSFLNLNNIDDLSWSAFSPDLSPTEHLWDQLGRHVSRHSYNVDFLKDTIKEEWEKLSPEYLRNTCASFRKRVKAVIEKEEGHIE
uniref:Tc1-like transposase DDE domain-containing protein n=1 Tax=Sphaeramia orbicularis TaxID=375764 RepID=A0A673A3Q6_9TELE